MSTRLTFRRSENDTATDLGYVMDDGSYAAIRIADTSDTETIAGRLRALAARIDPARAKTITTSSRRRRWSPIGG